jgi:hypothetical protein
MSRLIKLYFFTTIIIKKLLKEILQILTTSRRDKQNDYLFQLWDYEQRVNWACM